MNLKLSLFAATLLISSTALDATAAGPTCQPAADIARALETKYHEALIAVGLQSNGDLLQVYYSTETGTWTLVSTTPAGVSCIVAAGKHWEQLPLTPTDPTA